MRLFLFYFFLLLPFGKNLAPQEKPFPSSTTEAPLIVFLQYEKDQHFITSTLPKLKAFVEASGITIEVRDALAGLPEEITSTPAVVFQNHQGRNIYAARYASFSTLQNFIRTSRRISPKVVDNCKENIPVLKSGRTQIGASIKLTNLAGVLPKNFDEATFQQKATQAINRGFERWQEEQEVCLQKSDRLFYLDFHPYRNEAGVLFLSGAIYSQFSCIVPIWSNFEQAKEKSYEDFESLFSQLANQMETVVFQQLLAAKNGDALSFVESSIPVKTWESLDLKLPPPPMDQKKIVDAKFQWSEQWSFYGPVDEYTPIVQFRFPEPLDRYVGEVKKLKGQLRLNGDQQLWSGQFEVDTKSLTMGIDDFDAKVHKDYIKVKKFPKSSFSFGPLQNQVPIKINESNAMVVPGTFELMGKKIPIEVVAQITPTFGESDQSLLQVEATFTLNITDDFKIKGPDGPAPANKTLLLTLNFLLNQK